MIETKQLANDGENQVITLSELNRSRKKAGDVMRFIGMGAFMAVVSILTIMTLILWVLDGVWTLLGYQSSGSEAWIAWANHEITYGRLKPFVFIPVGIGLLLFLLGTIVGIGKKT